MPDPQDQPDHGDDTAPQPAAPAEPVDDPQPGGGANAKEVPARPAKKAPAKKTARKAPAKKTAGKSPAKRAPAKKAPGRDSPAAEVRPTGTDGAGAREAAEQAKSAVQTARSAAPATPPPRRRSPTALLVAGALGLLTLFWIQRLRRCSAEGE